MNTTLLWIVTAIYLVQCAIFAWSHRPDMALVLLGYSIANGGLIWSAMR